LVVGHRSQDAMCSNSNIHMLTSVEL
jgi:hypothetical protein